MANEFLQNRVVMGSFTLPAMAAASTASTLSAALEGLYVPAGAIVTRVGFVGGAQTEVASMKDAVINVSVSNIALLSNNVKGSVAMSVGVACTGTLAKADGVYVSVGAVPSIIIGASDASRSGVSVLGTVHIGYILNA
jgi:hypothetical protein